MRVLDQSRIIDGVGAARSAVATRGDRRDVGARGTFDSAHRPVRGPLSLLMAIVVILLLLACANIGGCCSRAGPTPAGDGGARLARRRTSPHGAAGADRVAAPGLDRRRPGPGRRTIRRHHSDADHDLGHAIAGPFTASGDPARCARADVHDRRHPAGGARLRLAPAIAAFVSAPASALRQGAEHRRNPDASSATAWWSRRSRSPWRC